MSEYFNLTIGTLGSVGDGFLLCIPTYTVSGACKTLYAQRNALWLNHHITPCAALSLYAGILPKQKTTLSLWKCQHNTMKHPTQFSLIVSFILASSVTAIPLQLDLPSTLTTIPTALNTTNLQQHSTCFGRTVRQRLYPTTFVDCHNALKSLIGLSPHLNQARDFSRNSTLADFKLPSTKESGTCKIVLSTSKYNDAVPVSMLEIYNNLMDEKMGVLTQCLHMPSPLGGETSLGWETPASELLFVDVREVPAFGPGALATA